MNKALLGLISDIRHGPGKTKTWGFFEGAVEGKDWLD